MQNPVDVIKSISLAVERVRQPQGRAWRNVELFIEAPLPRKAAELETFTTAWTRLAKAAGGAFMGSGGGTSGERPKVNFSVVAPRSLAPFVRTTARKLGIKSLKISVID